MDPIPNQNMMQPVAAADHTERVKTKYSDLALKLKAKIRKEERRRNKYREQSYVFEALYKTSTSRDRKIQYLKIFIKMEQKYFYHLAQLGKARRSYHDELLRILDPSDE